MVAVSGPPMAGSAATTGENSQKVHMHKGSTRGAKGDGAVAESQRGGGEQAGERGEGGGARGEEGGKSGVAGPEGGG